MRQVTDIDEAPFFFYDGAESPDKTPRMKEVAKWFFIHFYLVGIPTLELRLSQAKVNGGGGKRKYLTDYCKELGNQVRFIRHKFGDAIDEDLTKEEEELLEKLKEADAFGVGVNN